MGFWLDQLREHLSKIPGDGRSAELPLLIEKGAAYMADASAEVVRISARTTGLVNSARRAL